MTLDRDLERTLDEWLESGPVAMPDWVLNGAFERIERAPQRRLPTLSLRFTLMHPTFRLAAAATLALFVGLGVLPLLTPATPSPASSPSPSAPASAVPASPATARSGVPTELQGTWVAPWRAIDGLRNTEAYGVTLRFMAGQFETTGGADIGLKSLAQLQGDGTLRLETTLGGPGCETGDVGTYTWSVEGEQPGSLTIAPILDSCSLRAEVINGTFRGTGDCQLPNWWQCLGPLAAGEHGSLAFEPRAALLDPIRWTPDGLTFTVPDGWVAPWEWAGEFPLEIPDSAQDGDWPARIMVQARPVALDSTASLTLVTPKDGDPYCAGVIDSSVGRSVDDLVAYLVNHPGLEASAPVELTIGGHRAVQVDVDVSPSWTAGCAIPAADGSTPEAAPFVPLWADGQSIGADGTATGWYWGPGGWTGQTRDPFRFILVDLGKGDVVLISINTARSNDPARHDLAGQAAFVERAMPIVESFRFRD